MYLNAVINLRKPTKIFEGVEEQKPFKPILFGQPTTNQNVKE